MKEKLIKLLSSAKFGVNNITLLDKHDEKVIEEIADHLLANGVVVKGEREMTVDEKRDALNEFCGRMDDCKSCPLHNSWRKYKWEEPMHYLKCPSFRNSPESDLDKAMEICGIDNTI